LRLELVTVVRFQEFEASSNSYSLRLEIHILREAQDVLSVPAGDRASTLAVQRHLAALILFSSLRPFLIPLCCTSPKTSILQSGSATGRWFRRSTGGGCWPKKMSEA
jgi:hypothetical protein